jgi:hypothetical protein
MHVKTIAHLKLCGLSVTWALCLATTAHAQKQDLPPIYFAAIQEKGARPVLKFVFSKRSSGAQKFEPTHAFRIAPDREQHKCNTERTDDFRMPDEYLKSPLYDSADLNNRLPEAKLPGFFATVVSAELARKGLARTADESLPYHTCTRLLWEHLLGLQR